MQHREHNIPITLDSNSISQGRFLTDAMVLKIAGTSLLSVLPTLVVFNQLAYMVPKVICIIVTLIVFILIDAFAIRKLCLGERKLIKLLDKAEKNKLLNVGNFWDIYNVTDSGVARHNNKNMSMALKLTRGTTIQATREEKDNFWRSIGDLENALLANGFNIKLYNIEDNNYSKIEKLVNFQLKTAKEYNEVLYRNLLVKYKYQKYYTKQCMVHDTVYIVVYTFGEDDNLFDNRVRTAINSLHTRLINQIKVLNKEELL